MHRSEPPTYHQDGIHGYETRDAVGKRVAAWLAGVALTGILAATVAWIVFHRAEKRPSSAKVEILPVTPKRVIPEGPLLQARPQLELEELRKREEQILHSYGWVDQTAGKVRIPVDRAMELILERGLPHGIEAHQPPQAPVTEPTPPVVGAPESGNQIAPAVPQLPPGARLDETVTDMWQQPAFAAQMLDSVERGTLGIDQMSGSTRGALLAHPDSVIRERAETILLGKHSPEKAELVGRYRDALTLECDPTRGAALFSANCAICHAVGGTGRNVGPDLSQFQERGPEALLADILDPSFAVDPNYATYAFQTDDGSTHTGVFYGEEDGRLIVKDGQGSVQHIAKDSLIAVRPTGISLMPEGFEEALDVQSMADLLGFLRDINREELRQVVAANLPPQL